ncbi:leucine zipper domain-containing protein [Stutzerimonas nitrititolerans]|uniref:leucine zipper domain-containing protein n=1 Tax=Stutzerimonas nitrititolerans TaxID=2482751 RepID=UPI0035E3C069
MNVHKHARLTPSGRALLVQRTFQGARYRGGCSGRWRERATAYKWLKRFREEGIRPDRSLVTPTRQPSRHTTGDG